MLVFKRFASTGSPKAKLEEFFTYHTTSALLKPWIYRPKNANYLLTMDMKDPNSNRPLQPRKPVGPLSRKVLNDYIESIPARSNELVEWFRNWTQVTPRKRQVFNYVSSQHIQLMLVSSFFKLGSYDELLMNLYNNKAKFLKAQNNEAFDVEHFFNTIIMCKLHKNHLCNYRDAELAKRKLIKTWKAITNRNDKTGLANALVSVLARQQGFEVDLKGLSVTDIVLPKLGEIENTNPSKLLNFIQENRYVYLMLRTIVEFSNDGPIDSIIENFISSYRRAAEELGKDDIYDNYIESMKNLWITKSE
ncbi:hypothetical protein HG535_0A01670 [Zygotorulaspora mrakii]|uniref:Uncharacterized protein n=1 Tax=Zygotorulaspora mrakii TaxID=42260 RepID=A0A7H9AWS1_ZYGMR|nr:uncharacterized protein HG535_0A01670 [Zygotorulaspora mrakii]QLG70229.1 hypothetical protein HG535_0A01670 [Zygotorulaspora mrakii]